MAAASQLTPSAVSWLSSSREDVQRSRSRRSRPLLTVQSFRSIMAKFVCIGVFYFCIYILCAEASPYNNASLYRLPQDFIQPELYDIFLHTNVTRGNFSYTGVVTLHFTVQQITKDIIFHSDSLRIIEEKVKLHRAGMNHQPGQELGIESQHYDYETQFYIVTAKEELRSLRYILIIPFEGQVRDDFFGFYRSSYKVNNETRWIGVTQFSPVFARRAFPCMDEPGLKASFKLRIGHYENETVISNTHEESTEESDIPEYVITTFAMTPPMSTYLLAWAIHDFHRVSSSDPRIWLWTRLDDSDLSWSLSSSPAIIDGPKIYAALQSYFEIRNPLMKLEQIAVPDFKFSAMENWGLITYRESSLIVRLDTTPVSDIPRILVTVAHEYAHTWFGNLVTPESWSFPWLKEGFATYFSYYILSTIHEDWNFMNLFSLQITQGCLFDDSKDHDKLMNKVDVGSPKSAANSLDFITYNKAASIIRMVAEVMGKELFKRAIFSYLSFGYMQTANPPRLYEQLDHIFNTSKPAEEIPVTIGELIDSWANQPNYPLIRVKRMSQKRLRISQELFQGNYSKPKNCETRLWWIPLTILLPMKNSPGQFVKITKWLGPPNQFIDIYLPHNSEKGDWFLLNPSQIGYFRTDYDEYNWLALIGLLKSGNFWYLSAIDRTTLLDDAFNLAKAEYKEYREVFRLYGYLIRETEYEPWVTATTAFRYLYFKLRHHHSVQLAFQKFAIDLLTPIYKKLSFEESPFDSYLKKVLRTLILSTACDLNHDDCIFKAKSIFDDWIADEDKPVPVNLRSFVYCTGIRNGTDDDLAFIWEKFLEVDYYTEKSLLMNALTCSTNSSFINEYLDFAIDPESDIPKQDRLAIIQGIVGQDSENIEIMLNYVEENLSKIIESRGVIFLKEIFSAIGDKITSVDEENKLKGFITRNLSELGEALEAAERAVTNARATIDHVNRSAEKMAVYLHISEDLS